VKNRKLCDSHSIARLSGLTAEARGARLKRSRS